MVLETWYHLARTPRGLYVHRIDPLKVSARVDELRATDPELSEEEATAEVHGEYAEAIRALLGFPPRGRWITRDGWQSVLSTGTPHPSVLEGKANDDIDELPDLGPVPAALQEA
jgi:hypothetical protein